MTTPFEQWLSGPCQLAAYQLDPLPGDASFRRYARVHHAGKTYMAMDASTEKQSCIPFVAIAQSLRKHGLSAPEILASDLTQGFLLLTDFGDRLYLNELNITNAIVHYQRALDALLRMQDCQIENWTLKPFTAEFMQNELQLFKEWFLEKYLKLNLTQSTHNMLDNSFYRLAENAAAQPYVFMHRDYHSANLMILPENQVGILDFQDAFIGPITYDLVSLLRDCYIDWPENIVNQLVTYFWEKNKLSNMGLDEFIRQFDWMGMQRHLKALLTFSRKYCRDNNANYLRHIPRTVNYVLTISERYPETKLLHEFLKNEVIEKCVE